MPSSSRNSRKTLQAVGLGISAMLLLGTAAHAAGDTRFMLSAYTDFTGGAQLVRGDYTGALEKLSHGPARSQEAGFYDTNLCVALTMTQQWDAARSACDRAVEDAQSDKQQQLAVYLPTRERQAEYLAMAYSNRAVLKWLSADARSAAQDLSKAQSLAPAAAIVARNVAALGVHSTVAQVSGTPRS